MRLGAAKDTEITRKEPRWLVNWRHQTLQSQIVRRLESIAETQPQLHPALLRLSAITSQFFIRFRAIALMIMSVGLDCGFEFEKGRQLLICGGSGARRAGRACRWLASEVTVALPLRDCSQ